MYDNRCVSLNQRKVANVIPKSRQEDLLGITGYELVSQILIRRGHAESVNDPSSRSRTMSLCPTLRERRSRSSMRSGSAGVSRYGIASA